MLAGLLRSLALATANHCKYTYKNTFTKGHDLRHVLLCFTYYIIACQLYDQKLLVAKSKKVDQGHSLELLDSKNFMANEIKYLSTEDAVAWATS